MGFVAGTKAAPLKPCTPSRVGAVPHRLAVHRNARTSFAFLIRDFCFIWRTQCPASAIRIPFENGAGERLTFLRREPGTRGDRLIVENTVSPGSGPPMHVHYHQDEALTVTRGRMAYVRQGEVTQFAGPGESVFFAAGEVHRFWNAGNEPLVCTGFVEPADNIEYFLSELYASTRRNGGKGPNPFDAAFLAWRYRREFGLAVVPAVVQRLIFPLQIAIGRLMGKYARYADAPEPVRREAV